MTNNYIYTLSLHPHFLLNNLCPSSGSAATIAVTLSILPPAPISQNPWPAPAQIAPLLLLQRYCFRCGGSGALLLFMKLRLFGLDSSAGPLVFFPSDRKLWGRWNGLVCISRALNSNTTRSFSPCFCFFFILRFSIILSFFPSFLVCRYPSSYYYFVNRIFLNINIGYQWSGSQKAWLCGLWRKNKLFSCHSDQHRRREVSNIWSNVLQHTPVKRIFYLVIRCLA